MAESVIDQVTDVFVEAAAPVNHLVKVATTTNPGTTLAPPITTPPPPSMLHSPHRVPHASPQYRPEKDDIPDSAPYDNSGLSKQVELFRRHSRKLSQVAAYAAQSSTDTKRMLCKYCVEIWG